MKLREFFDFCIEQGIRKDPRGVERVRELLRKNRERYDKLSGDKKEDFDQESLANPYADSRMLFGSGEEEIKTILAGIDMETPELLLANTLRSSGRRIDLALAHHPEGRAYATLHEVMSMQADILNRWGVPVTAADSLTSGRQKDVGKRLLPQNHNRAVDAARLLGLPFMSAHTVADNQVNDFLQRLIDERAPGTLDEVVSMLREIPEYRDAVRNGTGPTILVGSGDNRPGKIVVDMTGGTEGPKDALEKIAASGVGTIVGMHMSDEHQKLAEKHHLRVVIAGHISSDTLGMNLLLDEAEKRFGEIETIECSGFKRYRRTDH